MDKIEKIRQEIERRITDNTFGAKLELIDILAWLDTLSEEPDKSLEEEIDNEWKKCNPIDEGMGVESAYIHIEAFDIIVRHFFELGLNARKSIWHNVAEEIPTKNGSEVIVACRNKNKEDGIWLYDLIQCWEGKWEPKVNWETPVKWAYVEDLDSVRKEENK